MIFVEGKTYPELNFRDQHQIFNEDVTLTTDPFDVARMIAERKAAEDERKAAKLPHELVFSTHNRQTQLINVLKEIGYTEAQIVEVINLPKKEIKKALHDPQIDQDEIDKIKKGLSGRLWRKANDILNIITPEKLKFIDPAKLAVILGITLEKALLLDGKATKIVSYQELTGEILDIDAKIRTLEVRKQITSGEQQNADGHIAQ